MSNTPAVLVELLNLPEGSEQSWRMRSLDDAEGKVAFAAMQSPWSDRIRAKIATSRERRLFRIDRVELGRRG